MWEGFVFLKTSDIYFALKIYSKSSVRCLSNKCWTFNVPLVYNTTSVALTSVVSDIDTLAKLKCHSQ